MMIVSAPVSNRDDQVVVVTPSLDRWKKSDRDLTTLL